ncbi:SDR family oxidoreductase [Corynebacterium suedekumii]|nr:SDR family oxidoreductase [Corynebacterium suedekumii]
MAETSERVAVVTGAGGGLGRTFAAALAADGWSVACLGRTAATLEETVGGLAGVDRHLAVVCDVADEAAVTKAFATVTDHYGRLDLLVNNAGIPGPTGDLADIDAAEWRATMDTNLTGTFLCTRAAFQWMRGHGGGRIINNGSIAGHRPRAGAAAYAASKRGGGQPDGHHLPGRAPARDHGDGAGHRQRPDRTARVLTGSEPMFDAADAARLLRTVANLPAEVSVDQVTVTAAGMPYLGRG